MSTPLTSDDLKKYDVLIKQYIQQQIQQSVTLLQSRINEEDSVHSYDSVNASPMVYAAPRLATYSDDSQIPVLMSIQPEIIEVQEDIQEDYIIYDRVITPNENIQYKNIVVTGDDKSNRIFFNMWYTFDDRELSNKTISIIWINANNEKGESLAVDKEIKDNNRLVFAWDVPIQATYKEGTIQYAIRITDDDYAWHTLPSSIECVKGLMSDDFNNLEEAQLSPGWVDYIEGKYGVGVQKITFTEYTNLAEKSNEILYLVINNDGTITTYLGDTLVSEPPYYKILSVTEEEYNALNPPDEFTLYLIKD